MEFFYCIGSGDSFAISETLFKKYHREVEGYKNIFFDGDIDKFDNEMNE